MDVSVTLATALLIVRAAAGLAAGFVVPGYLLSVLLGARRPSLGAFPVSLIVLYNVVFVLGICGVPLTYASVLGCLLPINALLLAVAWRKLQSIRFACFRFSSLQALMLTAAVLMAALMALRTALHPLSGWDVEFRWHFLAEQMLRLDGFQYYPPVTPQNFRQYSYPDGIPPLVSFLYWWLYECLGSVIYEAGSTLAVVQYLALMLLAWHVARLLYGKNVAFISVGMIAATPLMFRSVAMTQETGLTALGTIAMVYFLLGGKRRSVQGQHMVLAGIAAAIVALSREYGWLALACGVLIAVRWRFSLRWIALLVVITVSLAGPWYLRNWVRAGNPFYNMSLGIFPVNPVHAMLIEDYRVQNVLTNWSMDRWREVAVHLLRTAPLQFTLGVAGAAMVWRRRWEIVLIGMVFIGFWLWSAQLTHGGTFYASRLLTPALAVFAITGAYTLSQFLRRMRWSYWFAGAVVALALVWTMSYAVIYPYERTAESLAEWPDILFAYYDRYAEDAAWGPFASSLSPKAAILADDVRFHRQLSRRGVDLVPIYSPDVRFVLTEPDPVRVRRQLLEMGVGYVIAGETEANTQPWKRISPFYAEDRGNWHRVVRIGDLWSLYRLPSMPATAPASR